MNISRIILSRILIIKKKLRARRKERKRELIKSFSIIQNHRLFRTNFIKKTEISQK